MEKIQEFLHFGGASVEMTGIEVRNAKARHVMTMSFQ